MTLAPRGKSATKLAIYLNGPEWEPLFAYADSQGISPSQAARELLFMSLQTSASDTVLRTAMREARTKMMKIAYEAIGRGMKLAYEDMLAQITAQGYEEPVR